MIAERPEYNASAEVCGFLPASKVICSVTAVNSYGESPSILNMGYTPLKCMLFRKLIQKHFELYLLYIK